MKEMTFKDLKIGALFNFVGIGGVFRKIAESTSCFEYEEPCAEYVSTGGLCMCPDCAKVKPHFTDRE